MRWRHQNVSSHRHQQFTPCPSTVLCTRMFINWCWWKENLCGGAGIKVQSHLRTCCCFPDSRKHVILPPPTSHPHWHPQVQVFTISSKKKFVILLCVYDSCEQWTCHLSLKYTMTHADNPRPNNMWPASMPVIWWFCSLFGFDNYEARVGDQTSRNW